MISRKENSIKYKCITGNRLVTKGFLSEISFVRFMFTIRNSISNGFNNKTVGYFRKPDNNGPFNP